MSGRVCSAFVVVLGCVLAACTTREAALVSFDGGSEPEAGLVDAFADPRVTTCEGAFETFFRGERAPCELPGRCSTGAGACCVQELVCEGGVVVGLPLSCAPDCVECRVDRDCPMLQFCGGTTCSPCPPPPECPRCSAGLEPVVRNGCATCECAPASQCRGDGECAPDEQCLPGQACAADCLDPDPLACCANACGQRSCPFPVPLGCISECPAGVLCDGPCMTTACACDGMAWTCERICAPIDLPLTCML